MKALHEAAAQHINDESIFCGWHEFDGYRFESRGSGNYSVYRKAGHAYVHCAAVTISARLRGQKRLQALRAAIDTVC